MEMIHFIPSSQRRLLVLAAQDDLGPVLISGASGTGKGAIARWIHQNGPRAGKPYTVAQREHPILDQLGQAQGGTFLIPEIGSLTLTEQQGLLTYLKTKTIPHQSIDTQPLQSSPSVKRLLNVRVMASTSQALAARAQGGLFNSELLEKLNVYRIEMPALSERTEEFEDIALGILREIAHELHKDHIQLISAEAFSELKNYDWPGNLRELRNVLRVAVIHCQTDKIEMIDLPDFGHDQLDFRSGREEFEKVYLTELLKTYNWQIDKTCDVTKLSRSSLLAKIEHYGIRQENGNTLTGTDLS